MNFALGVPMSDFHSQPMPDDVAVLLARAAGRLGPFAHEARWYSDVPSTNDIAAAWAERGASEGCVVVADTQSAGRGRQGRHWASPAGAGLYVSTVLRPTDQALPLLTIAAGLGLAEGIQAATALVPELKWPNDAFMGGRKVAGVLAEATSSSAGTCVVLGFGINVSIAAYPPDVAGLATSLEQQRGEPVEGGRVLVECLSALAHRYLDLAEGRRDAVLDAWRGRASGSIGRRVRWSDASGPREGGVDGIDDAGALVVRSETGPTRITAGEVQWL